MKHQSVYLEVLRKEDIINYNSFYNVDKSRYIIMIKISSQINEFIGVLG